MYIHNNNLVLFAQLNRIVLPLFQKSFLKLFFNQAQAQNLKMSCNFPLLQGIFWDNWNQLYNYKWWTPWRCPPLPRNVWKEKEISPAEKNGLPYTPIEFFLFNLMLKCTSGWICATERVPTEKEEENRLWILIWFWPILLSN